MSERKTAQRWEKTSQQNLVRHRSGTYYARLFHQGKEVWRSLKTQHFSVAKARLAEKMAEHEDRKDIEVDAGDAKMTVGQAATLYKQKLDKRVGVKRRTRQFWLEILKALSASWPELDCMEVRRLTTAACRDWAADYARTVSATRYNATIGMLKSILGLAVENGIIHSNPALIVKRRRVLAKKLVLPSRAQFTALVAEMRAGRSRDSRNCADLVEGLAYTGCRKSEASHIEWCDIDSTRGELLIKGDPEEGTKNWEIRRIPLIPSAAALFRRMRESRADEPETSKVFLVRECQKSMERAAKKVGMARITHHDLRHLFATICIESGVDIPTVSRWLGHKDGGALAMKTYGHLRNEHSLAQAQKVSFAVLQEEEATYGEDEEQVAS